MKFTLSCFLTLAIIFNSCTTGRQVGSTDDGRIKIDFIQVNDVYEIAPLSGGKEGGIARIATLKKKYLQNNSNSVLVMTGDFLSPSVFNSLKYQGKAIRGRQMIEAMNTAGFDMAIFGNHEFDIKEQELQDRINESDFQWISSNTFHWINGQAVPFAKIRDGKSEPIPQSYIKTFRDADGTTAKIGFIALTLPFNKAAYVNYTDVISTAREIYNRLINEVDAVVALTHQTMEEDILLANAIPGLAVIMGGHEHDQRYEKIGKTAITKAMANARTAFIVTLHINQKNKKVRVRTNVEQIDTAINEDSACVVVVKKWVQIAEQNYASLGFDAGKTVRKTGESLDGRETEVRNGTTNLTNIITAAMMQACPKSDIALLNAGSIRVDDLLQSPVTQYDIIRTLPFGGSIIEVDMQGSLLQKILSAGIKNKGSGGYLHYNNSLTYNNDIWKFKNESILPEKTYRVALTDFLLTGGESNLGFLKAGNEAIIKIHETPVGNANLASDIRLAVIRYLETH